MNFLGARVIRGHTFGNVPLIGRLGRVWTLSIHVDEPVEFGRLSKSGRVFSRLPIQLWSFTLHRAVLQIKVDERLIRYLHILGQALKVR